MEQLARHRDEAQALLSSAARRVEELPEGCAGEPAGEVAGGEGGVVDPAAQQTSGQVDAGSADPGVTFDDVSPDGDASDAVQQVDGVPQADGGQEGSGTPAVGQESALAASASQAVHGKSASALASAGQQQVDAALQAEYDRLTAQTCGELNEVLISPQDSQAYGGTSAARVIAACATVPSPGLGWCYRSGIITGHASSGLLKPRDAATRAQLAKILTVLVRDVLA